MLEQQLVDYIKKAREAGQADAQTMALLTKNGWTDAEIQEAISSMGQLQETAQSKPVVQSQPVVQPEVEVIQPEIVSQPQVVAQPQPAMPSDFSAAKQQQDQIQASAKKGNTPYVGKRSHVFVKLLMVLIILVVLGGAAFFVAGQYINLPWNPLKPDAATVIGKMMTNMKDVKTSHSVSKIEFDIINNTNKSEQANILVTAEGDNDVSNANSTKGSSTFTIKLMSPMLTSPLATLNVSTVMAAQTLYFKVNNITVADAYASYIGASASQIQGKWLKLDQDSAKALSAISGGSATMPNVSQADTLTLTKKMQDLVLSENIFSVNKQLDDQVVSGQNTYHYLLTISKDKMKSLMTKVVALEVQEASKMQSANTQSVDMSSPLMQNMIQSVVTTVVDALGDVNVEVWIGKKDYLLYEAKFDKTIDLSKVLAAVGSSSTQAQGMQFEIKFDSTGSNFNKTVTIQIPEGAQKVEDMVMPILKQQNITADMSQIGYLAQYLFSTSKSHAPLCNKGMLNGYLANYGPTLVQISTDIVAQGAKRPGCFSDATSYCVSIELQNGGFMCVGGAGTVGSAKCTSAKTVCK